MTPHALLAELSSLPPAIAALPRDARGYPIPWFVAAVNGDRSDLRLASPEKRLLAYRDGLCWVCGRPLGRDRVFVGGPMSVRNRVFGDWCCHPDCAEFSLRACPHLNGRATRRSGAPRRHHRTAARDCRAPAAGRRLPHEKAGPAFS